MARVLGIDYGTKRVGIAATDNDQIIASGLTTVHSKDVIQFLERYILENDVEAIVIGQPKSLANTATNSSESVENFTRHLERKFKDLTIYRLDERFTSKLAFDSMIASGLSKSERANKELIDEVSATIILQDFLEKRSNGFI